MNDKEKLIALKEKYKKKCAKVKELNKNFQDYKKIQGESIILNRIYYQRIHHSHYLFRLVMGSIPCNMYNISYKYYNKLYEQKEIPCPNLYLIKDFLLWKIHEKIDFEIYDNEITIVDVKRIWN